MRQGRRRAANPYLLIHTHTHTHTPIGVPRTLLTLLNMPLKQTLENTPTTLEQCKQAEKDRVESAGDRWSNR